MHLCPLHMHPQHASFPMCSRANTAPHTFTLPRERCHHNHTPPLSAACPGHLATPINNRCCPWHSQTMLKPRSLPPYRPTQTLSRLSANTLAHAVAAPFSPSHINHNWPTSQITWARFSHVLESWTLLLLRQPSSCLLLQTLCMGTGTSCRWLSASWCGRRTHGLLLMAAVRLLLISNNNRVQCSRALAWAFSCLGAAASCCLSSSALLW